MQNRLDTQSIQGNHSSQLDGQLLSAKDSLGYQKGHRRSSGIDDDASVGSLGTTNTSRSRLHEALQNAIHGQPTTGVHSVSQSTAMQSPLMSLAGCIGTATDQYSVKVGHTTDPTLGIAEKLMRNTTSRGANRMRSGSLSGGSSVGIESFYRSDHLATSLGYSGGSGNSIVSDSLDHSDHHRISHPSRYRSEAHSSSNSVASGVYDKHRTEGTHSISGAASVGSTGSTAEPSKNDRKAPKVHTKQRPSFMQGTTSSVAHQLDKNNKSSLKSGKK